MSEGAGTTSAGSGSVPARDGPLHPPAPPLADDAIVLRVWSEDDADQVFTACQDAEIRRFIPIPWPYAHDDATAYIERTRRQWADGSKAAFAIVPSDDPGLVLGAVNLAIAGSAGNAAYWVAPWARGCGVASRALTLLADWALTTLGLGVVILEISPANGPSQQVARNAGFHEAGHLDVRTDSGERDHLIYSRLALGT